MKRSKKNFTLVELVIVAIIVVILLVVGVAVFGGMLSSPITKERNKAQLTQCTNNLKQLGTALLQYEMTYACGPVYSKDSEDTTSDGKLCAANLMRLYVSGLGDSLELYVCPVSNIPPAPEIAAASTAKVQNDADGTKYTTYNLTTCYNQKDPANKIVIADMSFTKGNVAASVHDFDSTKIDVGPNCLFKDGRVANVQSLCPDNSSEYELSPKGNIYRVDSGNGKGKDTCILGVDR